MNSLTKIFLSKKKMFLRNLLHMKLIKNMYEFDFIISIIGQYRVNFMDRGLFFILMATRFLQKTITECF